MKKNNLLRALSGVFAALLLLTIIFINPAYAQYTPNEARAEKQQTQYSTEELEMLRSKMLELLDTVQDFSGTITPNDAGAAERLQAARKQLEQFTLKDLTALRAGIDPSKMKDLTQERATLNEFRPAFEAYNNNYSKNPAKRRGKESGNITMDSSLPGIEGPDAVCEALVGSGRPSSKVVISADAVYFAAKILDIALNRGCNQVLVAGAVVLGEGVIAGANTSTACIVSDGILFAAEKVRDKVAACDNDFTSRSVDAAVKRLETVHSDLEGSVTNDNTNTTNILNNAAANTTTITTNDNTNKNTITTAISTAQTAVIKAGDANSAAIINNDNTNKNTIVANDNTNKDTIVTNDNTNKDTIVANDNANRVLLLADAKANKDFLLRTQIEADLSSTDGAVFVALYLTPGSVCAPVLNDKGVEQSATQCGYLDFARAVVVQTIANLAGANKAQANSFLATGDSYKTAGNYRQAYQNYRLAYKTAAGIAIK
jgi:hypothetical protein